MWGVAGKIAIKLSALTNSRIYAIDPSKDMIVIARNRARDTKNLHFDLGSSRYVPFKRKFDVIFTTISFHHSARKEQSLMYLSGLLSKNGELRIYEFNKDRLHGIMHSISKHSASKADILVVAKSANLRSSGIVTNKDFIRVSLRRCSHTPAIIYSQSVFFFIAALISFLTITRYHLYI